MDNFKQKLAEYDGGKHKLFIELFDELGIRHQKGFYDMENDMVFIKCELSDIPPFEDKLEKAMGIELSMDTIGIIGVLTDKGDFQRMGSGWVYINCRKVLEH